MAPLFDLLERAWGPCGPYLRVYPLLEVSVFQTNVICYSFYLFFSSNLSGYVFSFLLLIIVKGKYTFIPFIIFGALFNIFLSF